MKSFDEWFIKASQDKLFWESPSKSAKMGYEAGAASRQAEIDELQKRIDEALRFANDAHSDLNIGMLKMVEILKGKQDD